MGREVCAHLSLAIDLPSEGSATCKSTSVQNYRGLRQNPESYVQRHFGSKQFRTVSLSSNPGVIRGFRSRS